MISLVISNRSNLMNEYLRKVTVRIVICGGLLISGSQLAVADLRGQLLDLADTHGFVVKGLGLVAGEPDIAVAGDLRHQIKRLMAGYNYIVVDNESGDIAKLIILARGTRSTVYPAQPVINTVASTGEHVIPARRRGSHQVVDAVLVGPDQSPVAVSLMVDTGASTVVLPRSLIGRLGFSAEDLRDGWTQTANGRVRAKIGTLSSVDVGSAVVEDVKVTFLDDRRLGGSKLLGMSFLGHFSLTMDDANQRIILLAE